MALPVNAAPRGARPAPALAAAAALLLLTLACYAGVARNGFVNFDDREYLVDNRAVAGGLTPRAVAWAFTTTRMGNWHPVTWLSHELDVSLFGMRPGPHHLVSLAIHAANALLLLRLLATLTGALWPSALVAALFAVHPLHVESVAWASERKDVLAALFSLLALLAWARHVRRRGGRGPLAAAAALFALALMAKPSPVALPFLMLLLDWWPLGRWSPASPRPAGAAPALRVLPPWPLWREKLPLLALVPAAALAAYAAQARSGAVAEGFPLGIRAANAAVSYVRYLGKTLAPARLSFFYPHAEALPPAWQWGGALLLLAAATALALRLSGARPWAAVGWLWYLGALLPAIGIVQVGSQALADRYTYLPLVGVFVAAAWAAGGLAARRPAWRLPLAAGSVAVVALLGAATAARVAVWRDGAALFGDAIAADGRNWFAHYLYGLEMKGQGRAGEALAHFARAVELKPGSYDARTNYGIALLSAERYDEALEQLRAAAALEPRRAEAVTNLGFALGAAGRMDEAVAVFRAALAIDPGYEPALSNLGLALAAQGRRAEAAGFVQAARRAREARRDAP